MTLYYFIIYFGTGVIIIAFILSLMYVNIRNSQYYKYISLYIFLGLLLSTNSIIFLTPSLEKRYFALRNIYLIQDIIFLLQYLSLSVFLLKILKPSLLHFQFKFFKIIIFLTTLIQFFFVLFFYIKKIMLFSNIISNLFLIILSILYFRDLLKNKPTLQILESSNFWVAIGIFFYSCVSFPIYSLNPTISKKYAEFNEQIFSISNFSLIVMYFFFIKSFLCLKHPQNIQ